MALLQEREKEIFETLKKIKGVHFVVIGGYAVNAYTLPRFSVDCDIVLQERTEGEKISLQLEAQGYVKEKNSSQQPPYHGKFLRYVKKLGASFQVSMDILMEEIIDRQSGALFPAAWVLQHSQVRELPGKTIPEKLKIRIIDVDALVVMKWVSCRNTDVRDVFMLLPKVKDNSWVREEIAHFTDYSARFTKIKEKITSKEFKNNLQGVFGYVDEQTFEKHVKAVLRMKEE